MSIRLGIIGCGGACRAFHIPTIVANLEVDLVAVCDSNLARAEQLAKEFSVPYCTDDFKALLSRQDIDAVDICMPTFLHMPVIVAALEAGKHVFCEKPDAMNPGEMEKIMRAAQKAQKRVMIMRNNRFLPTAQFLKGMAERGDFGTIYAGKCGWQRRRGIPGKGGWITTKATAGGGPLIDLGIHMIDLAVWLMGSPRPVSASGSTFRMFDGNEAYPDSVDAKFGERRQDGTFDVEDLAMGFVRFDNGACLQIECSWASNVACSKRFVQLYGDKAGFDWDDGKIKIFGEQDKYLTDMQPNVTDFELGHGDNLNNFFDVLMGKAQPLYTMQQGMDILKIIDALYRSAEQGREIAL